MATPLERIGILGTDVAELVGTIGHNLVAEPEQRFFQRKVSNHSVHPEAIAAFRELSNRKSQELLEAYNAWLVHHQIDAEVDDPQPRYVSVGIYYHEHSPEEGYS